MENKLVSIGVPVFNGQKYLKKTLKNLIDQTYKNIEIIISDNHSTDDTEKICKKFANQDDRIKYFRQKRSIDVNENFNFTLSKATGHYFMWNAVDDLRSTDFIMENVSFLIKNDKYVASCSKDRFDIHKNYVNFFIEGTFEDRLVQFFQNCWRSQGIYYSLIRTNILKKYKLDKAYFASDWVLNINLLSNGNFNRLDKGELVLGSNGVSNQRDFFKKYRTSFLDFIFPFRKLIFNTLYIIRKKNNFFKIIILIYLLKANFTFLINQYKSMIIQILVNIKKYLISYK